MLFLSAAKGAAAHRGRKSWIAFSCLIALGASGNAQADGWKTAMLDEGRISVQYRISERRTQSGDTVPLIEDITTTLADVSMRDCVALMKDPSRHKDFMGDFSSESIKAISDNEWLVYYYTKNPWPIPDSDCVAIMTCTEDAERGTVVFTLSAAPEMAESRKVKRMSYYDVRYSFKDRGNGSVEIVVSGRSSPPVEVPRWMIMSAFPGAPADGVRKLIKSANAM